MSRTKLALSMLGVLIACSLFTSSAIAQEFTTFVSSTGSDSNNCTRSAPCRSIRTAVSKTEDGGEVKVIDAMVDEGFISITKSITIDGGNLASIRVPSGICPCVGININAGVSDIITIRNISLFGEGIKFLNGKRLYVENVRIQKFPVRGIDILLPAETTAGITVKDTIITGSGSSATSHIGILMRASSGTPTLTIDRSQIQGLSTGLDVLVGNVTISNSVVSNNSALGIVVELAAVVNVDNCVISHNLIGLQAGSWGIGGSTLRLSRNAIYDNATSISNGGGAVVSDGENRNSNPTAGVPNGILIKQ